MALRILVVGAGIAGPAICYWLKKFGFSPTLIEKTARVRKGGQAIDIRGIAVDVVKKMQIYTDIYQMRTRIAHGHYVDTQGNIIHEEEGEKSGFRQGDEVEILRGDLVEILLTSIKDIPCYFAKQINRITQHDEMVTVHFQDGNIQQYDLLIAADGIHSAIRRMMFTKDEYNTAFSRYNELLHPFLAANQAFGVWVSQSFLMQSELSPDIAIARSEEVMQRLQNAANAITLPTYEN